MTDGAAIERPVLWGQAGPAVPFENTSNRAAVPKVNVPTHTEQGRRLGSKMNGLDDAFDEQVTLMQSLGATDPQLVVVMEAVDERIDLRRVAELVGFEVLNEVEHDFNDDPAFPRNRPGNYSVSACLHAVCIDQTSKANLLSQWAKWQRTGQLDYGFARVRDLFQHLRDVRPWGPEDRIGGMDLQAMLDGLLPGTHEVDLELWFRQSEALRARAQETVARLVQESGGEVISAAVIPEVGYHGLKCSMPLDLLQRLASGDFDAVAVVRSSDVMYLRVTSQSYVFSEAVPSEAEPDSDLPTGNPVLCILDGYPVENHVRLSGRVLVYDPDDIESDSATAQGLRKHGTAMASVAVWGDLSSPESAATRPVLVRPILAPDTGSSSQAESLRPRELAPDLMRRVFRDLFGDSAPPETAEVVVVNLSVGDPASPFDGVLSSWARTLDWLSARYGVLVVVSAGNHGPVPTPAGSHTIKGLTGDERAKAVNAAVAATQPRRSLLAPADAINALTVGALSQDGTGEAAMPGYRFDAADGALMVSPLSGLGSGYRHAVKPDVVAPGGRVFFRDPVAEGESHLHFALQAAMGPGIRVAAPDGSSEVFTTGTSPAAAAISRVAASAADAVDRLTQGALNRAEKAVATKAFVAHAVRVPEALMVDDGLGHHAHGYGVPSRDLSSGCMSNEAVVLFVADLGAGEERRISLPLPNGLQTVGVKRVTATLAWMSPVNWKHRQYRRAALGFTTPSGGFPALGSARDISAVEAKRGTLQHGVWEITKTVAGGHGDTLDLRVQCREQAGGLHGERIDFAVVLSLWVAPTLGVDVYTQVAQQVSAPVRITARPGVS